MRFREEVLAKIFTYITVAVLLGIVAFEAWGLSRERSRRKDAEDNAAVLQEEVENMRDINTTLKKENGELSAFRNKWNVYVSSLTSSEVLELQHDLFMRTDLIPQEAKEEIAKREAGLLAEETDGKTTSEQSASKNKTSKTDTKSKTTDNARTAKIVVGEYSFDNPNGENIFLPVSANTGDGENCLIYTAAYEEEGSHVIELLYEITLDESGTIARRDTTGEVEWYCVAYQAGGGWKATATKEDAGNDDN